MKLENFRIEEKKGELCAVFNVKAPDVKIAYRKHVGADGKVTYPGIASTKASFNEASLGTRIGRLERQGEDATLERAAWRALRSAKRERSPSSS
jgi:hypothetical protein